MTKADIVDAIQQELQFAKSKSTEVVEQVLEILKSTLALGEDILISGFGKFCVSDLESQIY